MNNISPTTASINQFNDEVSFHSKRRDARTECGWIRLDTRPEMGTRQEMMPHIPKIELKFNDVRMDERIGGSDDTTKKIISRDPYK